jgi:hypothetical protein
LHTGFSDNKLKTSKIHIDYNLLKYAAWDVGKLAAHCVMTLALYGRFKLQMKNFPLLYLEILI